MSTSTTDVESLVEIAQTIPHNMTSGDLLRALIQAEQAGYQRCLAERPLEQVRLSASAGPAPYFKPYVPCGPRK